MPGALAGIRVIDFTEYIAGPYATMMLADMGADVVKVERPEGDAWRHTAPLAAYESRGFLGVNRGKRSIALDLTLEAGGKIARQLAQSADVVAVNYRPGVAQRLGLDFETLAVDNGGLVYCENTAFGPTGPYSGGPGYDILSQAATGMILYENKLDDGTPQFISTVAVADLTTGMFMAFAIVNALYARAATGEGQRIETNLFASGLAAQYRPLLSVEDRDKAPRDGFLKELHERRVAGLHHHDAATLRAQYIPSRGRNNYYRIYETADGLLAVACLNNRQRRALRDALAVDDPSVDGLGYDWFAEDVRRAHRAAVKHFASGFAERTTAELIELLGQADVPCNAVRFPEELYDDPHVLENDLMPVTSHPVLGNIRMPACPINMSGTPTGSDRPPPVLGADGPELLSEMGYDDASITSLLAEGVLHTRDHHLEQGH